MRGICRLRPGVPGVSDNISVRSIIGRFLEHQRLCRFGNAGKPEYYIGSADLMPCNLDRRVEAFTPVDEPQLTARLDEIIDVLLADNVQAWELHSDGEYTRLRPPEEPSRSPPTSCSPTGPCARPRRGPGAARSEPGLSRRAHASLYSTRDQFGTFETNGEHA